MAVARPIPPDVVVSAAQAGDEAAFERLVAWFDGDLQRIAYAVLGDADLAREAATDAWAAAWRNLPSLRDRARVRPWLVAIAANEARRVARQRQRSLGVREIALKDGATNPSDIDIDLRRALDRLEPRDRALVAMRFALGLDSDEIGAALGMSPSGRARPVVAAPAAASRGAQR